MIQVIKQYKATIVLLVLSLLCVYDLSQAENPDDIGLLFPKIVIGLLLALTLALGVITFFKNRKGSEAEEDSEAEEENPERFKMSWPLLGSVIAYIALLNVFGFFIMTPIFIFSCSRLFDVKTWKSIILALVLTVVIYLLFVQLLFVPFPSGLWVFKQFNEMIIY